MKFVAAIAVAACASHVAAKPDFVKRVPGASNVEGVAAIGHINPNGGGEGNAFGVDFYKAGTKWTVDLCYLDSDGDEQFNGAELGDPCCEWVKGTNEKLAYDTATAPGDKTSKQDPKIWANAKCADGQDPVTKYNAYMAKAGGAAAGSGAGASNSTSVGDKEDEKEEYGSTEGSSASATVKTPAPSTTPAPTKSAATKVVATASASAVVIAAAAFLL